MASKVSVTQLIVSMIGTEDAEILSQRFATWKASNGSPCPEAYYFGRDMPYVAPKLPSGAPFFHVHLAPIKYSNEGLREWRAQFEAGLTPTSNVALVYAVDRADDFLLIAVLPYAHEVCKMDTQPRRDIMFALADIAEQFIAHGLNDL